MRSAVNDLSSRLKEIEIAHQYKQRIDYFDSLYKMPQMANRASMFDRFVHGLQNIGNGKSNLPSNVVLQHSININGNDMPNEIQPFDCICFENWDGFLVIKLKYPIIVTKFEYVHIDKQYLPEELQSLGTKPRSFLIEGRKNDDQEWIHLIENYAEFEKEQYIIDIFTEKDELVDLLRISYNNWGSQQTCFYRMHVRGRFNSSQQSTNN